MNREKYIVYMEGLNGESGTFDDLSGAMLYAEALMNKYFKEPNAIVSIRRAIPIKEDRISSYDDD